MNLMAIYHLDGSEDFRIRVRMAVKLYGVANAEAWVVQNVFELAKDDVFINTYLGEQTEGDGTNPDQNNITDEMIMSKVRELLLEQGALTNNGEE